MSLAALQRAFRTQIVSDDDAAAPLPAGMAIYRDAYRGRLLAALEIRFERTRRWVGAESFGAAACHYILSHPPIGWTLDDYGDAFPGQLATLFAHDPEVAELAWLEWHRERVFGASDAGELDLAALSSAGYSERAWDALGFAMASGFVSRALKTNSVEVWEALDARTATPQAFAIQNQFIVVWRAGLQPRHRVLQADEFRALDMIAQGATLGQVGVGSDAVQLGAWLAGWLGDGLFAGVRPGSSLLAFQG